MCFIFICMAIAIVLLIVKITNLSVTTTTCTTTTPSSSTPNTTKEIKDIIDSNNTIQDIFKMNSLCNKSNQYCIDTIYDACTKDITGKRKDQCINIAKHCKQSANICSPSEEEIKSLDNSQKDKYNTANDLYSKSVLKIITENQDKMDMFGALF